MNTNKEVGVLEEFARLLVFVGVVSFAIILVMKLSYTAFGWPADFELLPTVRFFGVMLVLGMIIRAWPKVLPCHANDDDSEH